MEKYLLIERDGVINAMKDEPVQTPDDFWMLPFVTEGFFHLERVGVKGIVVTDQSGCVPDLIGHETMKDIHARMKETIAAAGGHVHDILVCPNHEADPAMCKFPNAGLFRLAASKYPIDLTDTYFISSHLDSLQAAWSVGCKTVLVKTGRPYHAIQFLKTSTKHPDFILHNFLDAVTKLFPL